MATPIQIRNPSGIPVMPIASAAATSPHVGNFTEGFQTAQAIKNVPVLEAQRKASLAQAGLTEAQSKQQQALLAALQQKLPPDVTNFDLSMIEYYFKETGGVPLSADGKVDLAKIRSQLQQAADLKQRAAAQAAEQAGVKLEPTTVEDPSGNGNVYKAVQAFRIGADGNLAPLGKPTILGLDEDATIKRAVIRSGDTSALGGETGAGGIKIPGLGGAGAKQPTQEQIRAAEFAQRLLDEEVRVQNLVHKGFNPAKPGVLNTVAWALSGDTKPQQAAFNFLASPEYKQFTNAARAWINAGLRNESGAALGEKEIARFAVTYFDQPGDDPATIEEKRQRREVLRKAMISAAGGLNTATLSDFENKIRKDPANAALFNNVPPTTAPKIAAPIGPEATTEEAETNAALAPTPAPAAPTTPPAPPAPPIRPQGDLFTLPSANSLILNPAQAPNLPPGPTTLIPIVQPNIFTQPVFQPGGAVLPAKTVKPLPTWNISPQ